MHEFARQMTDEHLIRIVTTLDRIAKPLPQRFEGDDTDLVELMNELGLKQDLISKLLITGEVLRECSHRGLQIPRPNNPAPENSSEQPVFKL